MSQAPTWSDVISALTSAFIGLLNGIANAISTNATVIGEVVIGLGLAVTVGYAIYRYVMPFFGRFLRLRL